MSAASEVPHSSPGSSPTLDSSPFQQPAGDLATTLSGSPRAAASETPPQGPGGEALQSGDSSGSGHIPHHALTSWPSGSSTTGEDEGGEGGAAAAGYSTLTQWLPRTSNSGKEPGASPQPGLAPPSPSLTFDSPFPLRTAAAGAATPLPHASSYEDALAALAGSQSYSLATAAYDGSVSPAAEGMGSFDLPPISGRSTPRSDGFGSGGLLSMLPVLPVPPPAYEDAGRYSNVVEATPPPPPPYDEAGEYPTLEVAGGDEDSGMEDLSR